MDEFDSITAQIYNIEEIFESTQEKLKYCIEDNNFYVDIDNNYQEQIKKSENLAKLMMNLTKDEQNFNDKNAKKYVDYHMNENENKIEQFTTQKKIFPNDKKDRYEEKYLKNVFSLQ